MINISKGLEVACDGGGVALNAGHTEASYHKSGNSAHPVKCSSELLRDITIDNPRRNHLIQQHHSDELTLEGIRQFYLAVEKEEWKLDTLFDLYETVHITQAIIFCNTHNKVEWLAEQLTARDFTVCARHGSMDEAQHEMAMKDFRSGGSRVLVAADISVRDVNVAQVSLIINYDFPVNCGDYLFRIGRAGRFSRRNSVMNFLKVEDMPVMREIERFYSTRIEEAPMNFADFI